MFQISYVAACLLAQVWLGCAIGFRPSGVLLIVVNAACLGLNFWRAWRDAPK